MNRLKFIFTKSSDDLYQLKILDQDNYSLFNELLSKDELAILNIALAEIVLKSTGIKNDVRI